MSDDPPRQLVRNVEREFGSRGTRWLGALPRLLERIAARWSLQLGSPFRDLSFSYVAPATRADGMPCVLKLSVPHDELRSEIESLGYWDGRGTVRLFESVPDEGALLLERLDPGTRLVELCERDDDEATRTAAAVIRSLWRPVPEHHGLRDLRSWFGCLLGHREERGGVGRFPPPLFDRTEALTRELIDSTIEQVLLHGDLHHFNILRASRAPWLAIDPKGLVGDPGFEIAAFLRNPNIKPAATLARRLDILSAELTLDRGRLRDWCFTEAMLNACWSLENNEIDFQRKLAWAELVHTL